jgi:hypothetical protein
MGSLVILFAPGPFFLSHLSCSMSDRTPVTAPLPHPPGLAAVVSLTFLTLGGHCRRWRKGGRGASSGTSLALTPPFPTPRPQLWSSPQSSLSLVTLLCHWPQYTAPLLVKKGTVYRGVGWFGQSSQIVCANCVLFGL